MLPSERSTIWGSQRTGEEEGRSSIVFASSIPERGEDRRLHFRYPLSFRLWFGEKEGRRGGEGGGRDGSFWEFPLETWSPISSSSSCTEKGRKGGRGPCSSTLTLRRKGSVGAESPYPFLFIPRRTGGGGKGREKKEKGGGGGTTRRPVRPRAARSPILSGVSITYERREGEGGKEKKRKDTIG